MIRIVVDSSSDYSQEEIKEKNLDLVSLSISFENETFIEGVNLTREEFYAKLEKAEVFPKTSQPSPQAFLEVFEDAKAKGDEVICITLSSALSGTYQSAMIAKEMAEYDSIYVIDSSTATYCIKVLADYALKLVAENKTAPEIVEEIMKLKKRVRVIAVLDTLEYLYKGGRLNKTTATIGELVRIKPVITVTETGEIGVLSKSLGKPKAMRNLLSILEETEIDEQFPIYTGYTHGTENVEKLENELSQKGIPFEKRLQIGMTIGTHVGKGVFGVVFVAKE